MASEPADATLRMLRDIRVAQEKHGNVLETQSGSLARLKQYQHIPRAWPTAHERYEALEARVEKC